MSKLVLRRREALREVHRSFKLSACHVNREALSDTPLVHTCIGKSAKSCINRYYVRSNKLFNVSVANCVIGPYSFQNLLMYSKVPHVLTIAVGDCNAFVLSLLI